jgi:hypothetical protein
MTSFRMGCKWLWPVRVARCGCVCREVTAAVHTLVRCPVVGEKQMTIKPELCPRQTVTFSRIDLYEYFARTRSIDPGVIEDMFANAEIRNTVVLYMYSGLPLAAAVIYLAHEMRDRPEILGPMYSLSPETQISRADFGADEVLGRGYGYFCGEIVKQLARFAVYRRGVEADPGKTPKLETTNFPIPLSNATDLHNWMKQLQLFYKSPDYGQTWNPSADYTEYLRYWMMAFWGDYVDIYRDAGFLAELEQKMTTLDGVDALYAMEPLLPRETPFLNKQMRVSLIFSIHEMLMRGLVTITIPST